MGQLKRENLAGKKTSVWAYDELGNITSKSEYAYTTGTVGTANKTVTYGYGNDGKTGWKNLLVSVDGNGNGTTDSGESISYDSIGNPTTYLGAELTWNGRELTSYTKGDIAITYKYDGDGLRASKTVNGVTSKYFYVNGQLHYEERSNGTNLYFFYDSNGYLTGIDYNDINYYPATNRRGDVVAIYDRFGSCVAKYEYDAWGNVIAITDASGNAITDETHIALVNPIRYRGYYYDSETKLYYLQSRYYNAEVGRFLNADGYLTTGQGVLSYNMFAYCGNNPVNHIDETGLFWKEIWGGICSWASRTFSAVYSETVTIAEVETPILPDPSPLTIKTGDQTNQKTIKHGDSSKPICVYANKDIQNPIVSSTAGLNINIDKFSLDISFGVDDTSISGSFTNGGETNSFGVKLNISEVKVGFESSTAVQWDETTNVGYTNFSISGWAIIAAYAWATTGQYVEAPTYAYN